jgi:hypothetical protein
LRKGHRKSIVHQFLLFLDKLTSLTVMRGTMLLSIIGSSDKKIPRILNDCKYYKNTVQELHACSSLIRALSGRAERRAPLSPQLQGNSPLKKEVLRRC